MKGWTQRTQAHARPQPAVGVPGRISEIAARRNHDDYFLGHWLEFSTKMTRALEHHDLLVLRFDAEMAKRSLVERLHPLARHGHADPADNQQRHRPKIDLTSAGHRAGGVDLAVAQASDTKCAL